MKSLIFIAKCITLYAVCQKNSDADKFRGIERVKYVYQKPLADMVDAVLRSLLSDYKVPSSILALSRFEYLCDILLRLS